MGVTGDIETDMSGNKERDQNSPDYRMSYRDVAMHKVMLQDVVRTDAYEKSIRKVVKPEHSVLDFGCGSGVLAIAAALLGAHVVAVDHDDQAITATNENAEINKVSDRVAAMNLERWENNRIAGFDVIVANILARPLSELADEFVQAVKGKGTIVLAGLLADQVKAVQSAYPATIRFVGSERIEDWVRLVGVSGDL